jgi:DNA-binding GntR family transcriptional regulator
MQRSAEDLAEQLRDHGLRATTTRVAVLRAVGDLTGHPDTDTIATRVRRVSEHEAVEILEVRAALESLAARKAAERADARGVRELRGIMREMAAKRERGDLMAVSDRNAALHRRILEMSGHETAQRLSGLLISQIVRFQYRTVLLPGRPERSHREHTAIVDAIAAGDPDAAERAMRRHLSHVADALRRRAEAAGAGGRDRSGRIPS